MVASPDLINIIRKQIPEWSVNSIAQAVGCEAIRDRQYRKQSRILVQGLQKEMKDNLKTIPGLRVFPSTANYFLCQLTGSIKAPALAEKLLVNNRISIRICENYTGLDDSYFRIAVKSREENSQLIDALYHYLSNKKPIVRQRPTPSIMFQGTGSNAGKSILTAAFVFTRVGTYYGTNRRKRIGLFYNPDSFWKISLCNGCYIAAHILMYGTRCLTRRNTVWFFCDCGC